MGVSIVDAHICSMKVGAYEPPPKVYNHKRDRYIVLVWTGFGLWLGVADDLVEVNL